MDEYIKKAIEEIKGILETRHEASAKEVQELRLMVEEARSIAAVTGKDTGEIRSKLASLEAEIVKLQQAGAEKPVAGQEEQRQSPWSGYEIRSMPQARRVPLALRDAIQTRESTSDFPRTPMAGTPTPRSQYPLGLLDVIPQITTQANTVDIIREDENAALGYIHTTAGAAYAAADTTITLDSVAGLLVGDTLRISNGTTVVEKTISAIDTSTKVVTLSAAIGIDGSAGDDVWSTRFGVVAEAGTKPYGSIGTTKTTKTMKTVPVLLKVTNQLLKDMDVEQWIRTELAYKIRASVEWHILYGDGTSDELDGFATDSDVQTHLWSADPTGSNRVDGVIFAGNEIRSAGEVRLILSRTDWARLRTIKDSTGQYLIKTANFGTVSIGVQPGNLFLDQYPVLLSEAVVPGDFFLVDLQRASKLYVRDSGSLAFGVVNDDFEKNQVTARYEMELVHGIMDPYAYVYGQWDSAP